MGKIKKDNQYIKRLPDVRMAIEDDDDDDKTFSSSSKKSTDSK